MNRRRGFGKLGFRKLRFEPLEDRRVFATDLAGATGTTDEPNPQDVLAGQHAIEPAVDSPIGTFALSASIRELTGIANPRIRFDNVPLDVPLENYTAVTVGPDGRLYAAAVDGDIYRWSISPDGTLGAMEHITSLKQSEGGDRAVVGLTFDPSSTAEDLRVWVTHTLFGFSGMPDFASKLTRLSGASLGTVQDYLINLPRSVRDHLSNQIDFGPDGALYFMQGSNTGTGAPDPAWANRPERLLSAAVLRFDPALWNASMNGPLDVHTEDADPYDPFSPGAPLTIFATGMRNAYDLLWHSNGRLYVPTNVSATLGRTPDTPDPIPANGLLPRIDSVNAGPYTGPSVPPLIDITTRNDFLFLVDQGGYYGHPNPARHEYVLSGGNPTAANDGPDEISEYPIGTLPDRNYRGLAFNFGEHRSPNGIIEYRGGAFGGALAGKILVVRYSMGDDIIVLEPGEDGTIVNSNDAISSFDGLNDPLDLTEDTSNGNIYVAEFAGRKIVLLRPIRSGIPGDFNDDGEVNAADYITWRNNLGLQVSLPNETSTLGLVTQEDYSTWRSNFGAISAAEPMSRVAPMVTAPATNALPVEVAVVDDAFGDFNTPSVSLGRALQDRPAAFHSTKLNLLLALMVGTAEGDEGVDAPLCSLLTCGDADEPVDIAPGEHDGDKVRDILAVDYRRPFNE